jgi:hypothetical protein
MDLPNLDAFEARGLYNVEIDNTGYRSVGQSAAGWATWRPKRDFPLLEQYVGEQVKFYWCSDADREAARRFRRCCQGYVLDALPMKSDSKGKQKERRRRILAWWEGDGLWLIVDEAREEISSLETWWSGRLARQQPDSPNGDMDPENTGIKRDSGGKIYADITDVFANMANALHASDLITGHSDGTLTCLAPS